MRLWISKGKQGGFTLVELMVVVSIAAVLVTVAVPQFCKYQSISKQAQAKMLLSSVWLAEQSFSLQSGSYTSCLAQIGVNASAADPLQFYTFGFFSGSSSASTCGPALNQACNVVDWTTNQPCVATDMAFNAPHNMDPVNTTVPTAAQLVPHSIALPGNVVTYNKFFAMAVGNISTCNSAYDRWYIDNTKTLVNDSIAL
jgi:prepilin-type N-terminal cleavage/methylation domain-containing protein